MAVQSINALEFKPSMIGLGRCYLILGTDAWLCDSVLDPIRRELKNRLGADVVNIYGDEVKVPQLVDVLDTFSIFSAQKLVILRNAESLKVAEQKALAAYVSSPSDSQSLVIIATKVDARLVGWKSIKAGCLEIRCDPPRSAYNLKPWLNGMLSKAGRKMEEAAIDLFISKVELDFANAANELQKLCLLTGNQRIGVKEVERSVGTSRVGTLADFYRALGRRDLKATLITVQRMLDSEWEALQVFFQFSKFYAIIHKVLALRKNHVTLAEIGAKHLNDLYMDQRQIFLEGSANYSLDTLRTINAILLETDSALKLSLAPNLTLLELCALRIMAVK
ncbi:MAG TPA: DNA polymerase III subunit delta [Candidatus Cloacimonadota bacterium]|nr:DNA polymerase III subunit delta [Candidatus Cloacimonadota bacterium]